MAEGRTIKDIMDNPESITDEEKKSFENVYKTLSEFSKRMEVYSDVSVNDNNNTSKEILKRQRSEYYTMAIVLESFFYCNSDHICFKDLNTNIYAFAPKDLVWDTSVAFINAVIAKMIFLGLVTLEKSDDEYNPIFSITETGISAYQDHRFQSLAASSFTNYQSYKTNENLLVLSELSKDISSQALLISEKSLRATKYSIVVAIAAIIVAIIIALKS